LLLRVYSLQFKANLFTLKRQVVPVREKMIAPLVGSLEVQSNLQPLGVSDEVTFVEPGLVLAIARNHPNTSFGDVDELIDMPFPFELAFPTLPSLPSLLPALPAVLLLRSSPGGCCIAPPLDFLSWRLLMWGFFWDLNWGGMLDNANQFTLVFRYWADFLAPIIL
jgi:hypothetical protein